MIWWAIAGMLDLYSDFTAVSGQLGSHIEVLEIDDLVARVRGATDQKVQDKLAEFGATFDVADAGMDPIMDRLGAGGSFTELYAMDLREQFVLMGHDGPMHLAIADRRPLLRKLKLYHGKRGFGISVECKVKLGPVSVLGVTQGGDGRLKFLAAGGESIPGPTFRIGNTNSRIRFSLDPAAFVTRWSEEGPTHHCALGIGDQTEVLLKVGHLLDVQTVQVSGK
jgi:L-arabinose isomerase